MKLLFSTFLVAVMAASLQAVTVKWTLQNSYWIENQTGGLNGTDVENWTKYTPGTGPDLDVYVFFEADPQASGGLDVATAASKITDGTYSSKATYDNSAKTSSTLNVYATLNDGAAAGYYYMVIFKNNDTEGDYIVAKTDYIAEKTSAQGVYYNPTGGEPNPMEYVQLDWVGGTWDAPRAVPEPTVMALLALGVAGLALRRKNG